MKNSFFKRAVATAAVVPLALTQCLTSAHAVTLGDVSRLVAEDSFQTAGENSKEVTLKGLTYIAPGISRSTPAYIQPSNTVITSDPTEDKVILVQYSTWYDQVYTVLDTLVRNDKTTGEINTDDIFKGIIPSSGKNNEITEKVINQVNGATYKIDSDKNLIITVNVDDFSALFEAELNKTFEKEAKNVSNKIQSLLDKANKLVEKAEQAESASENAEKSVNELRRLINQAKQYEDKARAVAEEMGLDISNMSFDSIEVPSADDAEKLAEETRNFAQEVRRLADEALRVVEDAKNSNGIGQVDFSNVKTGGAFEITFNTSQLADGTSVPMSFAYKCDNGTNYNNVTDFIAFLNSTFESYRSLAYERVDKISGDLVDKESVKSNIDKSINKYKEYLNTAESYYNSALNVKDKTTKVYNNSSEAIEAVNKYIAKNKKLSKKIPNGLPDTVSAIMAKKAVLNAYNVVINQLSAIAGTGTINIQASEVGSFADSFYDIQGKYIGKVANGVAKFDDDQASQVESYWASKGYTVVEDYKGIDATLDRSSAQSNGSVNADVKIYRYLELEKITTTTTVSTSQTETVTTTTVTTTSGTNTDSSSTTAPSSTTSTSVSSEESSGTTTTSATTGEEDTSSTTTNISGTNTGTETGTVTTTTGTSGTNTGTETGTVTTTTGTSGTNTGTETGTVTTITSTTGEEDSSSTTTTSTETTSEEDSSSTTTTEISQTSVSTTEEDVTTTTSTSTTLVAVLNESYVVIDTSTIDLKDKYGFYFSHDDRDFDKSQLLDFNPVIIDVYDLKDEDGNVVKTETEKTPITADHLNFNNETPNSVYKAGGTTNETFEADGFKVAPFKYEVPVYYDDEALKYEDGTPVVITAYIGVKGDANLDEATNSVDASVVMAYYAQVSVNTEVNTPDTVPFSISSLVNKDPKSVYDNFASFLADTNVSEYSATNWSTGKADRALNSLDASQIMAYYSLASTEVKNGTMTDAEAWNKAAPNRFKLDEE